MQEPAAPVVDPVLGHSLARYSVRRPQAKPAAPPADPPAQDARLLTSPAMGHRVQQLSLQYDPTMQREHAETGGISAPRFRQGESAIVRRDPALSAPAPVAGSAASGEAKQKIEAALQQSPQGREALQISQTLKIQIVYQANGPNQYRPETNVCLINSSLAPVDAAAYFVHEMYHAQRHSQDPSHDDPTKSTEDAFVNRMVQEEIDGTVLAIEAKLDAGIAPGGLPGEREYRSAYEYARKEAQERGSDAQASVTLGKQRGRKMVGFLIRPGDGSWPRLAPSQLESYEMYYRREWRKSNKAKAL